MTQITVPSMSDTTPTANRPALLAQLHRLPRLLNTELNLLDEVVAAKNGLIMTDLRAVLILMRQGSVPVGELAGPLGLTYGSVTGLVDRLERAGFARRVADPHDRRKVVVKGNEAKLEPIRSVYDAMDARLDDLLSECSTEQLQFLVAHYQASIKFATEQIARAQ